MSHPLRLRIVRLALGLLAMALSLLGQARSAGATGLLLPADGSLGPLAIRSHRVSVAIHERVAETRVVQVFRNQTNRVLEGTYIFPLPPGASVSGFAMTVNGQRVEGSVLEANEARGIYEGIVARMRDPGLVEYMGGNLFRARVFPIPASGDQTVELRFTQTVDYQAGTIHYRYPLRTAGPQARTMEDFTLSATLEASAPIRAVYSPTHRIDTTRRNARQATVGFELGNAVLDRDFDLYYTLADSDVGMSVLTHREQGEDGYFLMMLAPRSESTEREVIGKDILFVCDTSGSMAGEKMTNARLALRAWVNRLNPDDTFNVLRFSTDVETFSESSINASPENRARALRFIDGFEASGGTAIAPALAQALDVPVRRGVPRTIVFLTDGMPTVGETNTTAIIRAAAERNAGRAQIFTFGLGDDVNTTFLDLLAQQNRASADYARSGAEMATLLEGFYNRIAFPMLADLRLALRGADAFDVYPRDLGTLYRGGQLVVTGRYRTAGSATVALTATVASQEAPRTFEWPVAMAAHEPANDFIPRVWATRKVGYLLDEIRLRGENPEIRESVIQLARRFGIVTPYTSYLVTEESRPAPEANAPMEVPMAQTVQTGSNRGHHGNTDDLRNSVARPSASPAPSRAPAAERDDYRAFQSLNGAGPGRAGAASGGFARPATVTASPSAPVAAAMPAPAPPVDATGEAGRRVANRLRDLREAEQVDVGAGGARFVAGHSLVLRGGTWTEENLPPAARVLRVRAMSRSWFTLLRLRPALRDVLSVGHAMRFRLDTGRVIDVSDAGPDTADAEIESFLR
jgi:Ca-activated chloride channel family protein